MSRFKIFFIFLFLVNLLICHRLFGQIKTYNFSHLSIADGLSDDRVHTCFKDSRGFMWFTTFDGLCRYDGYNFKVYEYDPADSTSVSGNIILSNIIEDHEGFLWFGSGYYGLNRFDPKTEKFKRFLHDPNDSCSIVNNMIQSLYLDKQGELWIGTFAGINRYLRDSEQFKRIRICSQKQFAPEDRIYCMHEDKFGNFWAATGGGLFQFNRNKEILERFQLGASLPQQLNNESYTCISEDSSGTLWFGTSEGLIKYSLA